jgi:hypothetical protein
MGTGGWTARWKAFPPVTQEVVPPDPPHVAAFCEAETCRTDPPPDTLLKIRAAAPTYRRAPPLQPPLIISIADVIRILLCIQGALQKAVAGVLTAPWDSTESPLRGAHLNLLETSGEA